MGALRIAVTADPELPVPPLQYGGIERIVDMLVRGLVARGHDVTVFAHPDSATAGDLCPGRGVQVAPNPTLSATPQRWRAVFAGHFDLVQAFPASPILRRSCRADPKLMTYQREITRRSVRLLALSRGTLWFSAISRHDAKC